MYSAQKTVVTLLEAKAATSHLSALLSSLGGLAHDPRELARRLQEPIDVAEAILDALVNVRDSSKECVA